jgi:hypothetical protein
LNRESEIDERYQSDEEDGWVSINLHLLTEIYERDVSRKREQTETETERDRERGQPAFLSGFSQLK